MKSLTRVWTYLFFLLSSTVNFSALGFFTVYSDLSRTMTRDFANLWIGANITIALGFLLGRAAIAESSSQNLRYLCVYAGKALRLVSIFTFSIGFFKVTKYLLDEWTSQKLLQGLLAQQSIALLSVILGALFLRSGWTVVIDPTRSEYQETFRFFLYSTRYHHHSLEAGPRVAAPPMLGLLVALAIAPPFAYSYLLKLPSQTRAASGKQWSEIYQKVTEGLEIERKHTRRHGEGELDQADIEGLKKALELYREADEVETQVKATFKGYGQLGQARILIHLGHYEDAYQILNKHRIEHPKDWLEIERIRIEQAPMPTHAFALAFCLGGNPAFAHRLIESFDKHRYAYGTKKFNLLSLVVAIRAEDWDSAQEELSRPNAENDIDLTELKEKVKNRDSDVDSYLQTLRHPTVPLD